MSSLRVAKWLDACKLVPNQAPFDIDGAMSRKLSIQKLTLSAVPASLRPLLPSFNEWTLRARLIAMVVALALPLNLSIVAVVWGLAGAAQDAQRKSLLYAAQSVSAALDAELGKYMALAMSLSRSPSLLADDLTAFDQEARRMFQDVPDAWVLVASVDGQQLLNTAALAKQPMAQRLDEGLELQRKAFGNRAPVISGIRIGPVSKRWVTTIDVPIFKDGQPFRALVVSMTTDGFVRLFNASNMPKQWLAGIIDGEGHYVARVPGHADLVGKPASEGWRRTAGQDGLSEFLSRDGEPVVNANDVSRLTNWTVGIAITKAELNAAAWRATNWAMTLGALMSLMSLLLATLLARRISNHLGELRSNAKALLDGNGQPVDAPSVPELADVWSTLKASTDERNRQEEQLRRSSETYFRLIQNAVFGVYLVDSDFRLAQFSTGAQKVFKNVHPLLGRDFGEVLRTIWPEPFAAHVISLFRKTLETGEPYQSANTREIRQDTAVDEAYDWRIERVELPEGGYGVVCYFYDLSERLRHEEHIRLLMSELSHRSKNMFGIIQAIARRTKAGSVDDFVKRFTERLQALAANQDLLVATEWRGADLNDLARAQLATFADTVSGRIRMSGPSVMLDASAAQAIGMALHELATNAVKYGALSNDRGSVSVSWSVCNDKFSIEWVERGGPAVSKPTRRGFGTTMIDQMVRMSVRGTVAIDYAASGVVWRLECPLTNLTATSSSTPQLGTLAEPAADKPELCGPALRA